jgi:hypothetical protein
MLIIDTFRILDDGTVKVTYTSDKISITPETPSSINASVKEQEVPSKDLPTE